jgi:hypothetical protein
MAANVETDASLLDYQETIDANAKQLVFKHETKGGSGQNYGMGVMKVLYSELASATAGDNGAGDTINFFKLPPGTLVVGGWLYCEDGLGNTDGDLADLGVIYEDGDGTDDVDAFLDGADIYDGQTSPLAQEALPAGSRYHIGADVAVFPYLVTGGWGSVKLTTVTNVIVTAKDVKLCLFVILPF